MKPFRLGLTGSIGMGKSTTAQFFAKAGVPVWDADAVVHDLYAPQAAGAQAIGAHFPQVIAQDGAVSRPLLRALMQKYPAILPKVNALIHPLVIAARRAFIDAAQSDIVVLDIPLLFETGADKDCDAVVVVTAPPEEQRRRVLARGMSEADFTMINARQMPDAQKRAFADYIVETIDLDHAERAVCAILHAIRTGARHA